MESQEGDGFSVRLRFTYVSNLFSEFEMRYPCLCPRLRSYRGTSVCFFIRFDRESNNSNLSVYRNGVFIRVHCFTFLYRYFFFKSL